MCYVQFKDIKLHQRDGLNTSILLKKFTLASLFDRGDCSGGSDFDSHCGGVFDGLYLLGCQEGT